MSKVGVVETNKSSQIKIRVSEDASKLSLRITTKLLISEYEQHSFHCKFSF